MSGSIWWLSKVGQVDIVAAMAEGMSSVSRLLVAPRRTTAHEGMLTNSRTGSCARAFAPDDAAQSFVASFPIGGTDRI
jgi:hypothetical protein